EVQFRRRRNFYANLFAKVFSYLEMNNPDQDWQAVAIFENRAAEPKAQPGYQDLVASPRVRRIYLDELPTTGMAPPGLAILHLVTSSKTETPELITQLLRRVETELAGEKSQVVVELIEELMMRRFTELTREEVRHMIKLHSLRESRAWQETYQKGIDEGI